MRLTNEQEGEVRDKLREIEKLAVDPVTVDPTTLGADAMRHDKRMQLIRKLAEKAGKVIDVAHGAAWAGQ